MRWAGEIGRAWPAHRRVSALRRLAGELPDAMQLAE